MRKRSGLLFILFILCLFPARTGASPAARLTPGGDSFQEVLAGFEAEIGRAMVAEGIPGLAVAVVQNDEIVYLKGFGKRRLGFDEEVDPDTVFQIGSISKSFTSALVASVIDQGAMSWTDRVRNHLPSFKLYDPQRTLDFRVDDVMSQRSGLPAYCLTFPPFWGYSREQTTAALEYVKPEAELRSTFAYQNVFFLTAAQLIEKGSGLTWEQALEERIFEPLGMDRSSAKVADLLAEENHASFHVFVNGEVVAAPEDQAILPWSDIYGPAGGINSTARNMAAWLRLHLGLGEFEGRSIISRENMEMLHKPQTPAGESNGVKGYYCQGWLYSTLSPQPILWHNGDTGMAHSAIFIIPGSDLGLVILTNLGQSFVPDSLALYFYGLYFGIPEANARKNVLTGIALDPMDRSRRNPAGRNRERCAFDAQRYLGYYSNAVYEAEVDFESGGLKLILGPNSVELPLTPLDRDLFALSIPYFLEDAGTVRFRTGAGGTVSGAAVDIFANDGFDGVLERTE